MIKFEIRATPTIGKQIELQQSIASIQKKLMEISEPIKIEIDKRGNYQFLFSCKTEKETLELLKSDGFILLAGAIKTLCKKQSLILKNQKGKINLLNCKNLLNIKDYIINNNEGVTYAN